MIQNQVHNPPAKPNPVGAAVSGHNSRSGDTTAFESLMSALASEARSSGVIFNSAPASRGAIAGREPFAPPTSSRDSGVPSPAELAARAADRAATKPRVKPVRITPKPAARPEATRVESRENPPTLTAKSSPEPRKPQRIDNAKTPKSERDTAPNSMDNTGNPAVSGTGGETGSKPGVNPSAVDPQATATPVTEAEVQALEQSLAAELSGNPGVASQTQGESPVAQLAPRAEETVATPTKAPVAAQPTPSVPVASEFPANTAALAALSGETPAEAKTPAMDGQALMRDILASIANPSTSDELPVEGLAEAVSPGGEAEVPGVTGEVGAHEAPTPWPDAVNNFGGVLAGQSTGSTAAGFAPMNLASLESEASAAGTSQTAGANVSGVSGNATAGTPVAAPAPLAGSAAPAAVNPSAPTYAPNLPGQVFDQLQHHLGRLRALGEGIHQLKLAIKPEAFGPVRVAVNFQADGSVQLQLLGANEAARDQLRQALGEIRRDLASTGLNAQLDLAQSDQHFAQFTQAGQDGQSGARGEGGASGSRGGGAGDPEGGSEIGESAPRVGDVLKDGSDGSVDMYT